MHLTGEDLRSETWKRHEKYLDTRIAALRELNDGKHDPIKTASIRGQIDEAKRMRALSKTLNASTDADQG